VRIENTGRMFDKESYLKGSARCRNIMNTDPF